MDTKSEFVMEILLSRVRRPCAAHNPNTSFQLQFQGSHPASLNECRPIVPCTPRLSPSSTKPPGRAYHDKAKPQHLSIINSANILKVQLRSTPNQSHEPKPWDIKLEPIPPNNSPKAESTQTSGICPKP